MLEYLRRTFESEVILGEWLKEAHDSVKTQQYEKKMKVKVMERGLRQRERCILAML